MCIYQNYGAAGEIGDVGASIENARRSVYEEVAWGAATKGEKLRKFF